MAKTVVASLSSWRPGFSLRSVHVRFVVDREVLGQVFSEYIDFSVSIILPLLYTHFYLHVVLTGGQKGTTWKHYKSQCSFGNWGALDRKFFRLGFKELMPKTLSP
jgi:hypothetical protein